jgi:hypothetical protein
MLRTLAGIGRVLAQTWPALLAWYLVGSLIRAAVIAIAAPIGPESPLAALLLVPIIVLARLVTYVGMFLVLRKALTGYRALAGAEVRFSSPGDTVAEFVRVLVASIGPFFALYTIIGLLSEDLSAYARAAFRYSLGSDGVLNVGAGPLSLAVVIIAFAGRMALKFFGPRLPQWTGIVGVYLEATWVFVALTAISSLFGDITEWIANRQVVVWWENAREFLSGLWGPIRFVIDNLDWVTPVALQVVLLPLAWLFIASIVYLRALGTVRDEGFMPQAIAKQVDAGVSRVPAILRRYSYLVTGTWDEVVRPALFSGRIILTAGLGPLAIFLAAYGLLWAAGQWVVRGLYALVGPHDLGFWFTVDPVLSHAVSILIEPVRVVLLAVVFDYCLQRWRARSQPSRSTASVTEPVRT